MSCVLETEVSTVGVPAQSEGGRENGGVDGLREGEREREEGTQRSCSDQTEGTMMVGLSLLGSSSREVDTLRTAAGFLRQSSSVCREGSLQKACGPLG